MAKMPDGEQSDRSSLCIWPFRRWRSSRQTRTCVRFAAADAASSTSRFVRCRAPEPDFLDPGVDLHATPSGIYRIVIFM